MKGVRTGIDSVRGRLEVVTVAGFADGGHWMRAKREYNASGSGSEKDETRERLMGRWVGAEKKSNWQRLYREAHDSLRCSPSHAIMMME